MEAPRPGVLGLMAATAGGEHCAAARAGEGGRALPRRRGPWRTRGLLSAELQPLRQNRGVLGAVAAPDAAQKGASQLGVIVQKGGAQLGVAAAPDAKQTGAAQLGVAAAPEAKQTGVAQPHARTPQLLRIPHPDQVFGAASSAAESPPAGSTLRSNPACSTVSTTPACSALVCNPASSPLSSNPPFGDAPQQRPVSGREAEGGGAGGALSQSSPGPGAQQRKRTGALVPQALAGPGQEPAAVTAQTRDAGPRSAHGLDADQVSSGDQRICLSEAAQEPQPLKGVQPGSLKPAVQISPESGPVRLGGSNERGNKEAPLSTQQYSGSPRSWTFTELALWSTRSSEAPPPGWLKASPLKQPAPSPLQQKPPGTSSSQKTQAPQQQQHHHHHHHHQQQQQQQKEEGQGQWQKQQGQEQQPGSSEASRPAPPIPQDQGRIPNSPQPGHGFKDLELKEHSTIGFRKGVAHQIPSIRSLGSQQGTGSISPDPEHKQVPTRTWEAGTAEPAQQPARPRRLRNREQWSRRGPCLADPEPQEANGVFSQARKRLVAPPAGGVASQGPGLMPLRMMKRIRYEQQQYSPTDEDDFGVEEDDVDDDDEFWLEGGCMGKDSEAAGGSGGQGSGRKGSKRSRGQGGSSKGSRQRQARGEAGGATASTMSAPSATPIGATSAAPRARTQSSLANPLSLQAGSDPSNSIQELRDIRDHLQQACSGVESAFGTARTLLWYLRNMSVPPALRAVSGIEPMVRQLACLDHPSSVEAPADAHISAPPATEPGMPRLETEGLGAVKCEPEALPEAQRLAQGNVSPLKSAAETGRGGARGGGHRRGDSKEDSLALKNRTFLAESARTLLQEWAKDAPPA